MLKFPIINKCENLMDAWWRVSGDIVDTLWRAYPNHEAILILYLKFL